MGEGGSGKRVTGRAHSRLKEEDEERNFIECKEASPRTMNLNSSPYGWYRKCRPCRRRCVSSLSRTRPLANRHPRSLDCNRNTVVIYAMRCAASLRPPLRRTRSKIAHAREHGNLPSQAGARERDARELFGLSAARLTCDRLPEHVKKRGMEIIYPNGDYEL